MSVPRQNVPRQNVPRQNAPRQNAPRQVVRMVLSGLLFAGGVACSDASKSESTYDRAGNGDAGQTVDGEAVAEPQGSHMLGLSPRNVAEEKGDRSAFQAALIAEMLASAEPVVVAEQPLTFSSPGYVNRRLSQLLGDEVDRQSLEIVDAGALQTWQERREVLFPEAEISQRIQLELWVSDPIVKRKAAIIPGVDCYVCVSRVWQDGRSGLNRLSKGGCQTQNTAIGSAHAVAVVNFSRIPAGQWLEVMTRHGSACSTALAK